LILTLPNNDYNFVNFTFIKTYELSQKTNSGTNCLCSNIYLWKTFKISLHRFQTHLNKFTSASLQHWAITIHAVAFFNSTSYQPFQNPNLSQNGKFYKLTVINNEELQLTFLRFTISDGEDRWSSLDGN